MPNEYDIFITGGHRYQIIRLADNAPIDASFATRHEAERRMREIDAEEYGWEIGPSDMMKAIEEEVSARTVDSLPSKGPTGDRPGVVR